MIDGGHVASAPLPTLHACYFGQESGGQSGLTFIGLSPLCTCGAAEFVPPASGSTALFSMPATPAQHIPIDLRPQGGVRPSPPGGTKHYFFLPEPKFGCQPAPF